jgi:hypothetical protein
MERRRAGPQLVQPDPQQAQSVRVEDIEAVASVHQHLGEPGVPDDQVDHQQVLARIGDAVRVIFAAEGDGILDVKSAPHVKHTASQKSWLNTRCRIRSVPVNFP